VNDSVLDYDGLDVKGPGGDNIGNVDGFIVDAAASRVYYIVVDSGGWFSSRSFLLPVGHARLDTEDRSLRVDLTRDALRGYPEFDRDTFQKFSDDDLRAFERRMSTACCPDDMANAADETAIGRTASPSYENQRHYAQPEWWAGTSSTPRVRAVEADTATRAAVPVTDRYNEELVTARDADDESPHLDGRAQPGDILGIETGGERTHIGETAQDENKRRRSSSGRRDD
jgi:hypothetical protein